MGILGLERNVDNKRYDLTKRKNGYGAGCIITDRNEGVYAFKLLKQVKLSITFRLCLLDPLAKRCA